MMNNRFLMSIAMLLLAAMFVMIGCDKKSDSPTGVGTGGTGLTASVNPVSVTVGGTQQTVVGGGTTPYSIQTPPSAAIATASISGATVSVHGLAAGSTSMVVRDSSSSAKTVTINITVTGGGSGGWTTAGSFGFTTTLATSGTVRSFAANGIYNLTYAGSSGAGGWYSPSAKSCIIYGFRASTFAGKVDVAVLTLQSTSALAAGTFTVGGSAGNMASCVYLTQFSATDTANYMMASGTVNLTGLTNTNATGTFSGAGLYATNSGAFDTFMMTNGSFNVPVYATTMSSFSPLELKVRAYVAKVVAKNSAQR